MKVAITGSDGFLGTHARFFFHEKERDGSCTVSLIDRGIFSDPDALARALKGSDCVLHFAGINRGSDDELEQGNVGLADSLIEALLRTDTKAHVLFSSSTHEERDTPYGRGKKAASNKLLAYGTDHAVRVTAFVLPNLFGEFANPRYNSAVATFCDDLAEGRESNVNADGAAELLYVRDAIVAMWEAFQNGIEGRVRLAGEAWKISDLYNLLDEFNRTYRMGVFPDVHSVLELHLFNTLHSYLFDKMFPLTLTLREDERGTLFEIARSGRRDQTFYSTTKPGKVRGEHYHTRKMERFCVVRGEGEIAVRRLLTEEIRTFPVSGEKPVAIDMPTYYTHNLRNTGETDLSAVFWANEQFDPNDPDTFREPV